MSTAQMLTAQYILSVEQKPAIFLWSSEVSATNYQTELQSNPINAKIFPNDMYMFHVCAARFSKWALHTKVSQIKLRNTSVPCCLSYDVLCRCARFLHRGRLWAQKNRDSICGVCQGKQQTCIDRNTRHSHPWSDVVGGEGVSGWECTGGRVGGRVRRVWMVLDGSKEASLPSCGDKPSLALQHRVTHSEDFWVGLV